ncbi:MAG: GNAT family N-acetyltransferase [Eggerthellales bacterium]|nr:GNAT family N-acetyltransferase [Eggerthellales bacterium]
MIRLATLEHMEGLRGFDSTLVARTPDGHVAGFCRVREFDGVAYVNPLVTAKEYRRQGLGAALMREAFLTWGELRFVARGYAVGFYRNIGSVPAKWTDIAPQIACDCNECEMLPDCNPLPMIYHPKQ